jgi:hypothetical protein
MILNSESDTFISKIDRDLNIYIVKESPVAMTMTFYLIGDMNFKP